MPALVLPPCPHCAAGLHGLGRYCSACQQYVDTRGQDGPVPPTVVPDTRSEDEIEQAIMVALRTLGFHVAKLSQPRATMQAEGLSDLLVIGHGVIAFVEVKSAKGAQRPTQIVFEREVRAAGGLYLLWRSETEAIAWARELVA